MVYLAKVKFQLAEWERTELILQIGRLLEELYNLETLLKRLTLIYGEHNQSQF